MEPAALIEQTDANQGQASDPAQSAWVSANAGTGKTTVLVRRVLRLLLTRDDARRDFTRPESILCLTYTKAAAGEMENRLFRELSVWATLEDKALSTALTRTLGYAPDETQLHRARNLFALTLDTKGGLKIYTIHAFCERLLHRFPLEASIASGFDVLDEHGRRQLLEQAIESVLDRAALPDDPLYGALQEVIASAAETQFREIIEKVLTKREMIRRIIVSSDADDFVRDEIASLRAAFGVDANVSEAALIEAMADVLDDESIALAIGALGEGGTRDKGVTQGLTHILAASGAEQRVEALRRVFFRAGGTVPKSASSLATKAVRENHPETIARLCAAHEEFCRLAYLQAGLRISEASGALLALSDAIFDEYERRKTVRSALDYDDLIQKTASLLSNSQAAAWVLYKLDYGIDHVLVDEAQDTSPAQWRVIDALTDEFFAGASSRDAMRTVFAVGDEKQSIYSFQGAEPVQFARHGRQFRKRALSVSSKWKNVPLTVSFRSTEAVLDSVDAVCANPEVARSLTFEGERIQHQAIRTGQAGLVEIWPVEEWEAADDPGPFRPFAEPPGARAPIDVLASRIAGRIKGWLDNDVLLAAQNRPIRAGDILILVRRRDPFTQAVIRELKAGDVPVAGADRMVLTGQLAIMDLMALGDFLLQTQDDLSLACVLKSPLFGLDDDDLFALAFERKGSLWNALREKADGKDSFRRAADRLATYLERIDQRPPYEFYAGLLEENGMEMRHRLIARLGPDAGDAIDEFLNLALAFEREAPPTMQGFLRSLRETRAEVKRDMEQGRDEVRVMTVHGAKGLEAEIVFLPDTCSQIGGVRGATILDVARSDGIPDSPAHLVWVPPGLPVPEAIEQAKDRVKQAERDEYHRLLYVAMTRAKDQLYVCGWETRKRRASGCWYDLVFNALKPVLQEAEDKNGQTIWRYETAQTAGFDDEADRIDQPSPADPLPEWAKQPARVEPQTILQVAPSRIGDTQGADLQRDFPEQDILSPDQLTDQARFLRGKIVHALLEHLPGVEESRWEELAEAYVSARAAGLDGGDRKEIVSETLAVLRSAEFAPLFAPGSLAEVPIVARIEQTTEDPPLEMSGQIDRLAVTDNSVLIVDYKTNRPPPTRVEDVASGYINQLAAYRIGIRDLFPGKTARAVLLWTDGPRLMEIPQPLLDQAEVQIRASRPHP